MKKKIKSLKIDTLKKLPSTKVRKPKPIYWIRVLYLEDGIERDVDALMPCIHVKDWTRQTPMRIDHHDYHKGAARRANELNEGQYVYLPTHQVGSRSDQSTWLLAKIVGRDAKADNAMGPVDRYKVPRKDA